MQTRENGFEHILQEVLRQKQILEDLKAENQDLRRQLADLRAGRDICLDILGQRFSLTVLQDLARSADAAEALPASHDAVPEHETLTIANELSVVEPQLISTPSLPEIEEAEEKTPTEKKHASAKSGVESAAPPVPEMPTVSHPSPTVTAPVGFLEELLLDEFTTATTSHLAVWSGPTSTTHSDPTTINEEEKAALRRELMGSFLLE